MMKNIYLKLFSIQTLVTFLPLLILFIVQPYTVHYFDRFLSSLQVPNLSEYVATHRFLTGPYQPVNQLFDGLTVQVVSKNRIPTDLDGIFIRNGPNPIKTDKLYHWFDGHGMIHSLVIDPITSHTSATYSNGYVPTPRYKVESEDDAAYFINIGEFKGVIGLIKLLFIQPILILTLYFKRKIPSRVSERLGQANTNTIMLPDGRFLILHEGSLPFEAKLNKNGIPLSGNYTDFGGQINFPVSAHPRLIPTLNHSSFVFHCYSPDPSHQKHSEGSAVKYGEINAVTDQLQYYHGLKGLDKVVPFMHDFIVTENHLVFFKTSVLLDVVTPFFGKSDGPPELFKFFPDQNFKIAVVPRKVDESANVTWFDLPFPAVVVHTLNGWEEKDGKIIVWTPMGYDFDGSLVKKNVNKYYMTELIIDLVAGTVKHNVISRDFNVEFPRVRDECTGKPCRYGFSGVFNHDDHFHGFVRVDMHKKNLCFTPYHWGDKKFIGGEPVIVPKKGKSKSDQVYLASFVIDESTKDNYFAVWDGERCNGDAVVVIKTPRVPLGFHGNWISADLFAKHHSS